VGIHLYALLLRAALPSFCVVLFAQSGSRLIVRHFAAQTQASKGNSYPSSRASASRHIQNHRHSRPVWIIFPFTSGLRHVRAEVLLFFHTPLPGSADFEPICCTVASHQAALTSSISPGPFSFTTQKVAFQCSATCCDLRGPQGEMAQWYVRPGTPTMLVQKNPNLAHVNTTV